jgi:nitrite reductase/ring-hydroxylating ferredoxin subunit
MSAEGIVKVIDQQEFLGRAGEALQPAVKGVFKAAGEAGQQIKNALHGTWLGHPLHPVLTDIPVGAWTMAMVFDAMDSINGSDEMQAAADTSVVVGLIGAAAAAVTGLTDWSETDGRARKVGLVHGVLNVGATALYTTSMVMRGRGSRSAGRGFAMLGYAISMASAYLGGHLVYGEQIGVDHTAAQEMPKEFVRALPEGELVEGTLACGDAGGVPVLLLRQGGEILSIANTCAHLGGPLCEGKLEGDIVECPWHGSRFSVRDGHVVDGPATQPQPYFETRVRDGWVEVRAVNA